MQPGAAMRSRTLWAALLGAAAAGCITMDGMKSASVGHTGCTQDEMTISDVNEGNWGQSQQWRVDCRGKTFLCDRYGHDIGCHERL